MQDDLDDEAEDGTVMATITAGVIPPLVSRAQQPAVSLSPVISAEQLQLPSAAGASNSTDESVEADFLSIDSDSELHLDHGTPREQPKVSTPRASEVRSLSLGMHAKEKVKAGFIYTYLCTYIYDHIHICDINHT